MNYRIPLTQIPWRIAFAALPCKIYGSVSNKLRKLRRYGKEMAAALVVFMILFVLTELLLMAFNKSLVEIIGLVSR